MKIECEFTFKGKFSWNVTRDFTIRRRDSNENVKNYNSSSRQNNSYARTSHFFVHFFAIFARLPREIAWLYFLGRTYTSDGEILFSLQTRIQFLEIQLREGLPTFDKVSDLE